MALVFRRDTNGTNGGERGWAITEAPYEPNLSAKIESIFALGNGYMGVRAATEEHYAHETRGCYVAGLFDAFPTEVAELANLPDWLSLELTIDGERFSCSAGERESYQRTLDLRSGLLVRSVDWVSSSGRHVRLRFERFLSLADVHVGALRVSVEPLDFDGAITILSGIDGQVTNSGVQHLCGEELRVLPGGLIVSLGRTQQSGIGICVAACHRYAVDGAAVELEERVKLDRRRILLECNLPLERGRRLTIEKYASIRTGRDHGRRRDDDAFAQRARESMEPAILDRTAKGLLDARSKGFDLLFEAHRSEWTAMWRRIDVSVDGPDFDQLALRFALFHLIQMAPQHDPRYSIAAKGLTGEGYKGHVFWDTEIFILPVFTYTMPQTAARLLEYRFRTLDGARRKAQQHGYRGAMYPWESTDSGDETTPAFWGVDAATGRPIPILSGDLEQHISVEVPYAVRHYYQTSGDEQFMLEMGLEIMLETARFWASRVEWSAERRRYEITGIMGPDEYGERVSNNAYTSHMVACHLRDTAVLYERLARDHPRSVGALAERIGFEAHETADWLGKADRLFTNIDAASGFINQYDGFAEKKAIDLSRYRGRIGAIASDYGWEELKTLQVVKQADTVMLLYLKGDDFSSPVKRLNWEYYEPKTLHDSSLSPAIHSIVASDMDERDKAYSYFERAARIDLGEDAQSSNGGIHAAALGGIWQAAVNGFAGVRVGSDGRLRISPRLPNRWEGMSFPLVWHGRRLQVAITHQHLALRLQESAAPFEVECRGSTYTHSGVGTLEIDLSLQ